MEAGRRSSTALLLLLALMLAVSNTSSAAAAAQRPRQPATGRSYKLITVETSLRDRFKLAVRADGSSIAGFANNKNDWFAIQGSEDLLQPYRDRYGGGGGGGGIASGGGGGGGIASDGLVTLLGAMVKKNATS